MNLFPIGNTDLSRLNHVDWKTGFLEGLVGGREGDEYNLFFYIIFEMKDFLRRPVPEECKKGWN